MLPSQQKSRCPILWLALGLTLFSGQACSAETGGKIQLPANTQMVLTVGQDGNVTVLDIKGQPAPPCKLCTQELEKEYGPYCKKAPDKLGLCAGLVGVTVQDVNTATILSTHKNPLCLCSVIDGNAFCLPVGCTTRR